MPLHIENKSTNLVEIYITDGPHTPESDVIMILGRDQTFDTDDTDKLVTLINCDTKQVLIPGFAIPEKQAYVVVKANGQAIAGIRDHN